jgi:ectoine utilization protein EutC
MAEVRILSEAELRRLVPLDAAAVSAVEEAFRALASGAVVMPPILRLDIAAANGEVDVKTAYVPGFASFAIKVSPGFFDNPRIGLPSLNGLMILLSAKTGLLEAILLDNGYLTNVRTAAAGAVAAKYLSREDATTAAILGAGVQGRLQLDALRLVRPVKTVRIWERDPARVAAMVSEIGAHAALDVSAADDAEAAIAGADIVVTTTPASEPIVQRQWLKPGQHVTAMGADSGHKNEIDPALVAAADLYVPDRLAQTRLLGELHHAIAAGLVREDATFPELGDIVAGKAAGRTRDGELTICDLTGTGVQDTAIATLAFERAVAAGAGQVFAA